MDDRHVLTIVGYNDSIRFDVNNNNIIENNEKGAFKVANSWGLDWPDDQDSGYCYILYSLFNDTSTFLYGQYAFICYASAYYSPELTIKAKVVHPNRKYFFDEIGCDSLAGNTSPSRKQSLFALGNGDAGTCKLTGCNANTDTLEIAIDFSYLLDTDPAKNIGEIYFRPYTNGDYQDSSWVSYISLIDNRWGEKFELPLSNIPGEMEVSPQWKFSVDYDLLPFAITEDTTVSTDQIYRLSGTIKSGAKLQLGEANTEMELHLHDAEVIIEVGGTLYLSDSNSIIAKSGDNRIIVQGNLVIEPNALVKSEGDATLTIEFANDTLEWEVNRCTFDSVYFTGYCASNVFDSCDIIRSMIDLSSGEIHITDNDFDTSYITVREPFFENAVCHITGNSIINGYSSPGKAVITIDDYPEFFIEENYIRYSNHRGIELFYAGDDGQAESTILNNTILRSGLTEDSTVVGVHSYMSFVTLENNRIKDNAFGVAGFHEGKTRVKGDSIATTTEETQQIYDNFLSQLIFSRSAYGEYFHWNVIGDSTSRDNPFIKIVEYEQITNDSSNMENIPPLPRDFNVRFNCWIYESDPASRLLPVGDTCWKCDSVWCPGEHRSYSMLPEEILYEEGLSQVSYSEYEEAESTFKELVGDFPESTFACLSLKELYTIKTYLQDTGFVALKAYYDSISSNPADSLLGQTTDWLSIHCNVSAGNYQAAVNQLDSVLQYPGSFTDSIFALIDLGHVLTMMEDDSLKSSLISMHSSIMPGTYKEFKVRRKLWIDELLRSSTQRKPVETTPVYPLSEDQQGKITSIYPNPANDLLTINYSVKMPGQVVFIVTSVTGQKLISHQKNIDSAGDYKWSVDVSDLPEGVYFLSFYLSDRLLETKKIIRTN